jgi:flagellar FliL protein
MATREADLDLGGDAKKGGGKKPLLMMVGGAAALVAVSIGATMFLLGSKHDDAAASEHAAAKADLPATYLPLEPPFVVNFEDQGAIRFLQVSIEISTRDPKVVEAVKLHTPAIRDRLIVLFSSSDYATLSSKDGKEALREQAKTTLQEILKAQKAPDAIDGLYFTNFVMQ